MAAKDYWQVFPRSAPARFFHAYLVDRGGRGRRNQVKGMSQVLAAGDSILIFPEGTRGDGRTLGRFHRGLYFFAQGNSCFPASACLAEHGLACFFPVAGQEFAYQLALAAGAPKQPAPAHQGFFYGGPTPRAGPPSPVVDGEAGIYLVGARPLVFAF